MMKEGIEDLWVRAAKEEKTPELAAKCLSEMVYTGEISRDEELKLIGEKYGDAMGIPRNNYHIMEYASIRQWDQERLEQGFRKAFRENPDLFLDILYSGELRPQEGKIFTNDAIDFCNLQLEAFRKDPEGLSCYVFDDAQDFFLEILKDRYDDPVFQSIREAGDDLEEAATAFFQVADEDSLNSFNARMEEILLEDEDFLRIAEDNAKETAAEFLFSEGLMKKDESYLIFGGPINWRSNSSAKLVDLSGFDDLETAVAPKSGDYTIHIHAVHGLPYFTAMVYSHDVPTGGQFYVLPESKWNSVDGYQFLEDAKKTSEYVRNIFQSREALGNLRIEGKSRENAAARLLYDQIDIYLNNYVSDTKELYDEWKIEDAVYYASERLARLPEVQKNPKPFAELLEKYNPALQKPGEAGKNFMDCVKEAKAASARRAKQLSSR